MTTLLSNVGIVSRSLNDMRLNTWSKRSWKGRTYVDNLIGDLLSLSLALLEVRSVTIELGGVDILIKASFNSKQLLIYGELVP